MKNEQTSTISEELQLLRNIDKKIDVIESQVGNFKKQAVLYGAASGALSGAIVSAGILAAKFKLGL